MKGLTGHGRARAILLALPLLSQTAFVNAQQQKQQPAPQQQRQQPARCAATGRARRQADRSSSA